MDDKPAFKKAFKKSLGQHFLRSPRAVARIVAALEIQPGDGLLEIGPGDGVLTTDLLAAGARVYAVELDSDRIEPLRARFAAAGERFAVLQADVLDVPFADLAATLGGPFAAVGNLPYNVATAVLARVLPHLAAGGVTRAVFMFQREVAERVLAGPGSKDYGPLSLLAALYGRAERILDLGPGSFVPPPRVDSTVLRFLPHASPPAMADPRAILSLARAAFASRRKTLANNLLAAALAPDRAAVDAWIAAAGLPATVRAEAVPLAGFERLLQTRP